MLTAAAGWQNVVCKLMYFAFFYGQMVFEGNPEGISSHYDFCKAAQQIVTLYTVLMGHGFWLLGCCAALSVNYSSVLYPGESVFTSVCNNTDQISE